MRKEDKQKEEFLDFALQEDIIKNEKEDNRKKK